MTTNVQANLNNSYSGSKFNHSYQNQPSLINKIDYSNQNNTVHNNLGNNVLDESVVEYKINIDSLDRDYNVYPNPFDFVVNFNAPSRGLVRTEVLKNGKLVTVNDKFPGTPGPLINKEFRNVKYIKLDSVVLPQYSNNMKDENGKYVFDPDSYIVDDRFVVLAVDEFSDMSHVYSTCDNSYRINYTTGRKVVPPKPFGIIYPDTKLGNSYYTGTPYNSNKIYNSTQLGNLRKMSIKLYDSFGTPLGYNSMFNAEDLKCNDDISDIRHPLNRKIQTHFTFIVGVVEGHVNTDTKLEI